MPCNCKRKNQVINNLSVPTYVELAINIWEEIKETPYEQITEDQFFEMYRVYNIIYPNSKGQPDRKELVNIIYAITQYKVKTKKHGK